MKLLIEKNLRIGLNSRSDILCSVSCYIDGVNLLKSYIHILLVVPGFFVLGYIWDRILRKMAVVYLVFERM